MISFETFTGSQSTEEEESTHESNSSVNAQSNAPSYASRQTPQVLQSPLFHEYVATTQASTASHSTSSNDLHGLVVTSSSPGDRTPNPTRRHPAVELTASASSTSRLPLASPTGLPLPSRTPFAPPTMVIEGIMKMLFTKATEDTIASAVNDALADEIYASVELGYNPHKQSEREAALEAMVEKASLESKATKRQANDEDDDGTTPSPTSYVHVLELLDTLDSNTGGVVKSMLTRLRKRPLFLPNGQRKSTEYCKFCGTFRYHPTSQHRCRKCHVLGRHRSHDCDQEPASTDNTVTSKTSSDSGSSATSSTARPKTGSNAKASGKGGKNGKYCVLCKGSGFHTTEEHRCRICNALGDHRSRDCSKASTGESYRWRGSPNDQHIAKHFCEYCAATCYHRTEEHRCRVCQAVGLHRSRNCPKRVASEESSQASEDFSPYELFYCTFCQKFVAHKSEEHICRNCRSSGQHRSRECPATHQSMLSSSVQRIKARFLETLPLGLATSSNSQLRTGLEQMGDAEVIVRKLLRRVGVWGGGSQTPITTPYVDSHSVTKARDAASSAANVQVDYVLSYAEGNSVVPERIVKYLRLLMHHEVPTNAFDVVVRFDKLPSNWELQKPGMVTPHSLPVSPRMHRELQKRMEQYTAQVLLGARHKLCKLVEAHLQAQSEMQKQMMAPPPQMMMQVH